ncbi:LysR family transcriptional regulator [Marinimicrobium sp. ABcell2]|uniref:LysR family transcriptional regulator n=1 Tax=Marinimicrobium sp. ABcell2 TaxID=3069751 RepID=UPI0027B4CED0|nr:LysR family transcriptional regulator [Marinimicrobium sp. ABcell2]MDQ2077598.1 LysR family transcriptional regulator [Marinimicrobium sp. ABcell2]
MDIELLKTFIEVTQTRNFARAAGNMHLSPSAVSARIRQLEQALGVTLLFRKRGNIQMTAEGELLLPRAHQMLETWAQARGEMARQAEPASHLSLGATPGLWRFVLNNLSVHLRRELPELTLRAEAYSQDDLVERVLAKQLDAALVYELPGDPALKSRRVGQLSLVLLSSMPNLDLRSSQALDYVYVDWGAAFALFHARRFGSRDSHLYTNQPGVALDSLLAGGGCAYLPASLLDDANPGLYRVNDAPEFSRSLYLVCRVENEYAHGIQQLLPLLELGSL